MIVKTTGFKSMGKNTNDNLVVTVISDDQTGTQHNNAKAELIAQLCQSMSM